MFETRNIPEFGRALSKHLGPGWPLHSVIPDKSSPSVHNAIYLVG